MQQEIAAYGDWDAQLLEIHAGQLDLIQNNENVQTIMVKGDNQTALLPAASGLPYLLIQNCDGAYWGGMREKNLILRGRVPQAPGEIVVGKSFFEQNPSVEIGDRLNLDLGERRKGNTTVDFLSPIQSGEEFVKTGKVQYTIVGEIDMTVSSAYNGYPAYGWLDTTALSEDTGIVAYLQVTQPRKVYEIIPQISPIEAVRSSGYETATDRKDQKNHRITPFSMAQMNFRRSRKKTVITLVSLGLTGVFLVTAATVLNSISPEKMAIEAMGDHCNYEVSWMDSGGAEGLPAIARENPLTEELRQELLAIDGVESITSHEVTSATVKFPQESVALKFPVFDREQMEQWLPEENLEQGSVDYEELAANNGVIVTDSEDHLLSMFYGYTPAVGDVLTFESMDGKAIEVTVMGIAKPSVTSGTGAWGLFTLTEELADQLYPDIENREAVWNVHTSEDSDALRASIFSLLENPVLTVFSRADHAASLESQLKMMTRGVYLLLAFLFVFSMVNLVNTLMTNLLARQQELGILQSVGMTGKQVSRMLIAECLWYAGVTVFLSVGIGGILGWIFDYVISSFNIFGELSYQFPLMETVVFVLALLVVTGIFSVVAVRYSKRLSLVERIKTMD